MRRQGRWVFGVFIQVRDFTSIHIDGLPLLQKVLVAGVSVEVADINEIVDASLDVCYSRLIRRKPPLVIDHKHKSVLALLQIVNVREIVSGTMHRNLSLPVVKSVCYIHLTPAVGCQNIVGRENVAAGVA